MKSIKLNISHILILGLFVITLGCEELELGNDFLSKPPELDYTLDSAFANAERAKEVLWNAYSTMPYGLGEANGAPIPGSRGGVGHHGVLWALTDLASHDIGWSDIGNWYQKGTYDAEAASIFHGWRLPDKYSWIEELGWEGIRDSYIFLEHIDDVPDMDQAEKIKMKAEAKMIIATHYVEMFRNYGGILYVDHAYRASEDTRLERLTVMQSVDTITSIIDGAKDELPFELENPDKWSGRFTRAGALALKVKLLSFAAAPLFNSDQPYMEGEAASEELVWTGGYQRSLWERLRDVSKELIDQIETSSYYGLVDTDNPMEDYRSAYYDRGTGEILISTRKQYKIQGFWHSNNNWLSRSADWAAGYPPLYNYARLFPMQNGMDIEDPASGYDPQNPWFNRDPRLYESIAVNGSPRQGRKTELWIGGRERKNKGQNNAYTGLRPFKWILDQQEVVGRVIQWPYIRIPEVYLAYAEALNELNDGPTPEAFEYVNRIRERVNVGPIEDYIGKTQGEITKEEFLDALLKERILELGCENVRWYDMARYKMKEVFTGEDYGIDITLTSGMDDFTSHFQNNVEMDEHDQYFNHEVFVLERGTFAWQDNFSPKYYLSAFPAVEVQKGYGLIQNPGYETTASD